MNTSKRPFPIRPPGESPACFNCLYPTDPETVAGSGFPPGAGAFVVKCDKCGMMTYFDVEPEPVAEKP